jgi:hypothetical protein
MKINDILEGLKDPKDNPCWNGYHPVGTKKKRGKTVPNCVQEAANPAQQAAIAIAKKKKKDVEEAAGVGYIPKNKKEANDPRYAMAMTQDIKPGEDVRQAAKFGFKVKAGGSVPKLRPDGKF